MSRLNNYERGIRRLSIEAARVLANALGTCTPAYLLCVDDPLTLNADEIALLQKYRETDAQGRALVLKTAEAEANRTAKGDRRDRRASDGEGIRRHEHARIHR